MVDIMTWQRWAELIISLDNYYESRTCSNIHICMCRRRIFVNNLCTEILVTKEWFEYFYADYVLFSEQGVILPIE